MAFNLPSYPEIAVRSASALTARTGELESSRMWEKAMFLSGLSPGPERGPELRGETPGLHKHCRPRAGKMVILVYVFREGSCDYNYDLGGNGPGPGNCDL